MNRKHNLILGNKTPPNQFNNETEFLIYDQNYTNEPFISFTNSCLSWTVIFLLCALIPLYVLAPWAWHVSDDNSKLSLLSEFQVQNPPTVLSETNPDNILVASCFDLNIVKEVTEFSGDVFVGYKCPTPLNTCRQSVCMNLEDGTCREELKDFATCSIDQDCPGGKVCDPETCGCVTPASDSCFDGYNYQALPLPELNNFTGCLSPTKIFGDYIITGCGSEENVTIAGDTDLYLVLYKKTNSDWQVVSTLNTELEMFTPNNGEFGCDIYDRSVVFWNRIPGTLSYVRTYTIDEADQLVFQQEIWNNEFSPTPTGVALSEEFLMITFSNNDAEFWHLEDGVWTLNSTVVFFALSISNSCKIQGDVAIVSYLGKSSGVRMGIFTYDRDIQEWTLSGNLDFATPFGTITGGIMKRTLDDDSYKLLITSSGDNVPGQVGRVSGVNADTLDQVPEFVPVRFNYDVSFFDTGLNSLLMSSDFDSVLFYDQLFIGPNYSPDKDFSTELPDGITIQSNDLWEDQAIFTTGDASEGVEIYANYC